MPTQERISRSIEENDHKKHIVDSRWNQIQIAVVVRLIFVRFPGVQIVSI